ncbi:MAG: inositol monophosphatase family protein [Bacteriovoracaceae bacterium]
MKQSHELKTAIETAIGAGKVLNRYYKKLQKSQIASKKSEGLVSKADLESEKFIKKSLMKEFKDFKFLGEEGAFKNKREYNKFKKEFPQYENCWVVDPLDGTTNFIYGLDYFCVCIGLVKKGVPSLGVVYRPTTGEVYFAEKGKGAYKLDTTKKSVRPKKLKVTTFSKDLRNTLLVTGFAAEKGGNEDKEFKLFKGLLKKSRGVRRLGSAAIDICFVADGIFGAFWERGLAPWDICAAGVVLQEAGGVVSSFDGEDFDAFQSTTLATTKIHHKKLMRAINQYK